MQYLPTLLTLILISACTIRPNVNIDLPDEADDLIRSAADAAAEGLHMLETDSCTSDELDAVAECPDRAAAVRLDGGFYPPTADQDGWLGLNIKFDDGAVYWLYVHPCTNRANWCEKEDFTCESLVLNWEGPTWCTGDK